MEVSTRPRQQPHSGNDWPEASPRRGKVTQEGNTSTQGQTAGSICCVVRVSRHKVCSLYKHKAGRQRVGKPRVSLNASSYRRCSKTVHWCRRGHHRVPINDREMATILAAGDHDEIGAAYTQHVLRYVSPCLPYKRIRSNGCDR